MTNQQSMLQNAIGDLSALLKSAPKDLDSLSSDTRLQEIASRIASITRREDVSADAVLGEATLTLARSGVGPDTAGIVIRRVATACGMVNGSTSPDAGDILSLSFLQPISRAASSQQSLSDRLATIAELVSRAMQTDACTIFLHDDTTHTLALRAAWGMDPATIGAVTLRPGSGIVGQAALEQRTIVASNARQHSNFLDHPGLGDEQFTTQISMPMVAHGPQRLVGVLSVHALQRHDASQFALDFLESVAGLLAVTIDNERHSSRTDEELQRKITELATLQRVSRVVASTLELSEVLKLITEQAVELINAEAAAIFRLPQDESASDSPRPTIEYRIGLMRNHEDESSRDTVVREVLRSGVARTRDIAYLDGVSSVFCLPLNTARETVGALCFRLRLGTELDEEQLGLLQAFGDAAALAIDNARLYQEAITGIQTQSALVQEMHHRVRNNLQTVAALLSLQLRSDEDAPWTHELREAISRIQSIAAVHDLMSDASRMAGTTVDVIAQMVAEDAHSTLIPPGLSIRFDIPKSTLMVPSRQATIIALLINELAANAIHHGFAERSKGTITITARREDDMAVIQIANDGAKIPEGFEPTASSGLGMRITQRLVTSDLRGQFSIVPTPHGTLATIRFPIPPDDLANPPSPETYSTDAKDR